MTAWYRAGTVTATNGSAAVTGNLTAFLANAKVGDLWAPDADGRGYEITAVGSNTGITISPVYAGSTGSGKAYGIARISPNWNSVSEIAVSLAELLAAQSSILAGSGVPSDSLGNDGDVYFRQDVAQYYVKGSGTWTLVTSLVGPAGPAGPSYQGTSTSSVAIGTGSKTFSTQAGLGFSANQWVRVANSSSNYMEATVSSYSGTTLVINVPTGRAIGSGTFTSWNINIAGDVGPANSLVIGSVTTGAAGSSASASITGTAPAQTLNLTIPRGNTGVQGDTGPQGAAGAAATIAVGTVTTLTAGSSATVANAGTSAAAVFNFGIPRGADGADGADGSLFATTSTTSTTLSTGTGKVFTVATGLSFTGGNRLRIASAANPTTNWASAIVTAYTGSTLTVTIDLLGPTPVSAADWNIALTGEKGDQGPAGSLGDFLTTKGNIVIGDGATFGVHTVGANNSLLVADSAQPYGYANVAVDAVLAGGFWSDTQVASAATCDIGAAATAFIEITGTTTITSFGTVANRLRFVRFSGSLTLTYNGTSLVLPGTKSIITRAGDWGIFRSDASGDWRCIGWNPVGYLPRETLTANRTYYVRTDGNDANDGLANSSGGAFLTIQRAISAVYALDLSIYNVTIQLADGTWTESVTVSGPLVGRGTLTIRGNPSNPGNCIWSTTSARCLNVINGAKVNLTGFELRTTTSGECLVADGAGSLIFLSGPVHFGACAASHLFAYASGVILGRSAYSIVGGAVYHARAQAQGFVDVQGATITLTGTPAFSGAFARAAVNGLAALGSNTFSGSATGTRYSALTGGGIDTNGGGASYLPGSVAGSATSPAWYS